MRGEVKAIASASVRTYYRLHESSSENIKDSIEWLLLRSVFAYGGVDIKVQNITWLLIII
jgi:hypothetical protein